MKTILSLVSIVPFFYYFFSFSEPFVASSLAKPFFPVTISIFNVQSQSQAPMDYSAFCDVFVLWHIVTTFAACLMLRKKASMLHWCLCAQHDVQYAECLFDAISAFQKKYILRCCRYTESHDMLQSLCGALYTLYLINSETQTDVLNLAHIIFMIS